MLLLWLIVVLFSASDAFCFVSTRTSPLATAGNRVATPRHMLMKAGADALPKDQLLAKAIFGGVDKEVCNSFCVARSHHGFKTGESFY
jgi:hypothetical protein